RTITAAPGPPKYGASEEIPSYGGPMAVRHSIWAAADSRSARRSSNQGTALPVSASTSDRAPSGAASCTTAAGLASPCGTWVGRAGAGLRQRQPYLVRRLGGGECLTAPRPIGIGVDDGHPVGTQHGRAAERSWRRRRAARPAGAIDSGGAPDQHQPAADQYG